MQYTQELGQRKNIVGYERGSKGERKGDRAALGKGLQVMIHAQHKASIKA